MLALWFRIMRKEILKKLSATSNKTINCHSKVMLTYHGPKFRYIYNLLYSVCKLICKLLTYNRPEYDDVCSKTRWCYARWIPRCNICWWTTKSSICHIQSFCCWVVWMMSSEMNGVLIMMIYIVKQDNVLHGVLPLIVK